ncbi:hypothetical protein IL306_002354 [Fusarium sp. DS 682]|nr:hypothetical protein IL306_002354 [Fusarium sp. DS 682]
MGNMKTTCDYFDLTAPFTPLPKYGHLSKKTSEYELAEPSIRQEYAAVFSLPDFPSIRALTDDADAVMPPGGPDRYKDIVTELIDIPTRDGTMVELKVYKSPNVKDNAVLMYRMHGGATNPNIIVVSVDYRKAPEHPFPTPINDCYDGLLWNANRLGVDPEKIIISGGSAGGQLAASLALDCLRDGITGVIAQILHFPATCHPKFFPKDKYEYGSYIQEQDDAVLSTIMMENFFDAYLPSAEPDYRHSPLLAESFKGLPPTLIQCGGADPLRDDSFAYAEALKNDGVDVEVYCYTGLPHWFMEVLPQIAETIHFYERYTNFLAKHARN